MSACLAGIRGLRTCSLLLGIIFVAFTPNVAAQTWTWSLETVDVSARFTSLAVDGQGNTHISYSDGDSRILRYAFHPADSTRWFTMTVDSELQEFSTRLTLDVEGSPHICYTPRMLKYAHWDGKKWSIQRIAPTGTIEYTCSIAIGPQGTPHVAWYQTRSANGDSYFHLKHAVLDNGKWLARTVDFDGEAGKWSSLVVDASGSPMIVYSRFPSSIFKSAQWNGKNWNVSVVDSSALDRVEVNRGMGNSLVRDADGNLHASYYSNTELRYAEQHGAQWKIQNVDSITPLGGWVGFWSGLALDHQGFPHICYDDAGALKHAYWDGKQWHVQLIVSSGPDPYRYSSIGVGPDDTIFISFRDPTDGSLQVATGRRSQDSSSTAAQKDKKE